MTEMRWLDYRKGRFWEKEEVWRSEGCAEDGFGLDLMCTTNDANGRSSMRWPFILHDATQLDRQRAWFGLDTVGMVEPEVKHDSKTTITRRCFLCSRPMGAAEFAQVVQFCWQIEISLHWVLGVVFRDGHARVRQGCGARNIRMIKRISINLFESSTEKISLIPCREKGSRSTHYLNALTIGSARVLSSSFPGLISKTDYRKSARSA